MAKPVSVRIPQTLLAEIEQAADEHGHTRHAEILMRLAEPPTVSRFVGSAITEFRKESHGMGSGRRKR